ncbi:MAG: histidine--tRNA ligase [Firmicutes bacterium]|nr:histidine--tRNA ligase [Bacillota bacterium]
MKLQAPKGTKDILPRDIYKWHHIENCVKQVCQVFNFKEIRTPIFEHTELFLRGVGETTDIVSKEMYTFLDKGNRSLSLKPEGTAPIVRALIEHGQLQELPQKLFYLTPVFRYERPQAGRYRQHHQFGAELVGSDSPLADYEIIVLAHYLIHLLGLKDVKLHINTLGCAPCRVEYNKKLIATLKKQSKNLCELCLTRVDKNPLRVLDCKVDTCRATLKNLPDILKTICTDCETHFSTLQSLLKASNIEFEIDKTLVRGLDYYTHTVFEYISADLGAKSTVCGGGRYNGLIKTLGGKDTSAVGFGMGLERLLIILEKQNLIPTPQPLDVYFCFLNGLHTHEFTAGDGSETNLLLEANALRVYGCSVEYCYEQKPLKAQLKQADKSGAKFAVILGENEVNTNTATVKNMKSGEEFTYSLQDIFKIETWVYLDINSEMQEND